MCSNHGGRQLDGVPATIDVLEEIVEEPKKAQRQQPVGKNRAKKQGGRR